MLIRHITIENYRSIKRVDIPVNDMLALVGPNNAGKTNILSALNLVLGEKWPSRQSLDSSDWFECRTDQEIRIEIFFRDNEWNIEKFGFYATDSHDSRKVWFHGGHKEYSLTNEHRGRFPLVYIDASRSFESTFSSSRWSLFGRIVRHLNDDFVSVAPQETKQAVERHLSDAQSLLKTDLYNAFEKSITDAFMDQVKLTTHQVRLRFSTFDPLNFYKSLQPILFEGDREKNPSEVGSGMRNLIVLALFRAYAETFRGKAIIAIEEPEIYLHPHARRSLAELFERISGAGTQVLFSTHSATFINVARSDRIALVDRVPDTDGEVSTQVRCLDTERLLSKRKGLFPERAASMTETSMRERYRNVCGLEHSEAFFARLVVLVEGPSEKEALPIYAKHKGIDFDVHGVSVVNANGKTNIDALYHLYTEHGFCVYVIFDNDRGGNIRDVQYNAVLTRMLGLAENNNPDGAVTRCYTIFNKEFESQVKSDLDSVHPGLYDSLRNKATEELGSGLGKPLVARFIARKLVAQGIVPSTISLIVEEINKLLSSAPDDAHEHSLELEDDEIPF